MIAAALTSQKPQFPAQDHNIIRFQLALLAQLEEKKSH